MIFNAAVTTTTREFILKKVFDQVTTGTPGLMTFLQKPKEWTSGTSYKFPIKYQDTTNGGNMGIADKLDTDRQNVRVFAEFNLKAANKPVVVAIAETTANMGDEQIVNLLDTEFDSQAQSLMNLMAQNLYTGNGTGNDWDSLANAASDSTLFATYGGLSRSTYTAWSGYYLASAGALTLAKLATADDAVTIGVDSPDLALTTKAIWSTYESLLTPSVRANFSTSGYPRMNAWAGVPGNVKSTRGFQFRKMMSPVDQLTKVGYLIYAGNFVATLDRLQGQLSGAS